MTHRLPERATLALLAALAGLAGLAPSAARAGDLYTFVDKDGVINITNVPSDTRYRKVNRTSEVAGLYRTTTSSGAPVARVAASGQRVDPYVGHVKGAADKYKLPEALILAVMAVESNFDPRALSDKGAMGLMQLMPSTARDLYVEDAFDPAQNIEGGARYLRILANQYSGDMVKTLAAYNAGPDAVRRAGETVPDIPETREYVRKVIALYQAYKAGR
jgi:soluble lytic murein transglycosylase-like protein